MFDFRLLRYSVELGATKIIWFCGTPIIVPLNVSISQEQFLLAAFYTEKSGNVSIDNILKSHFNNYIENYDLSLKKLIIIEFLIMIMQ